MYKSAWKRLLLPVVCTFIICSPGCSRNRDNYPFDPGAAFTLVLGRGSRWNGLETIELEVQGQLTLHRMKSRKDGSWETATAVLPKESILAIAYAIDNRNLLDLRDRYLDPNIKDGTQWILLIEQGPWQKSTYFDNRFPSNATQFAKDLDAIVQESGVISPESWKPLPTSETRKHEARLWATIPR